MLAACALARPNTARVGRPATTSRKCPLSTPRVRHCRSTRDWVYKPTSTMNSGINGNVKATITAANTSWVRIATPPTIGTVTASTSIGR